MKEEGRRKREEGRGKKEEGRRLELQWGFKIQRIQAESERYLTLYDG